MFKDQVIAITGGASGIGKELALQLLRKGARVVVCDIQELHEPQIESKIVDVTDYEAVSQFIHEVIQKHGRLDIMINNAGIKVDGEFQDVPPEAFKRVIDINLMGSVYGTHAAYKQMIEQGHGHIVNISSIYGLIPAPAGTAYAAAKHGLSALTETLMCEGKKYGVIFSSICPGFIATNLHRTKEHYSSYYADPDQGRVLDVYMKTETAVEKIVKAIEKKKKIVVFPFKMRLQWWLYRLHPLLLISIMSFVFPKVQKYLTPK